MEKLSRREQEFIQTAAQFLEHPGFMIQLANAFGKPLDLLQKTLPQNVQEKIASLVEKSLKKTLEISISTLPKAEDPSLPRQPLLQARHHTFAAAALGAIGGFFGPGTIAIELPITTGIMFRSIANTAQSFGEDLQDSHVRLECLQIFAMGSPQSKADDAMKSAYFSQRLAFYSFITKASEKGAATLLARFITRVASEYQIVVAEKILAETLPILGAAGGAVINSSFTHYFNQTAYYHFGLRYLERKYGLESVQQVYFEAFKNFRSK
ncbi:MAG TPA: EcsC family protein [Pseudobdellovibrionaceae bacterium]|jgi:hypothetical protein